MEYEDYCVLSLWDGLFGDRVGVCCVYVTKQWEGVCLPNIGASMVWGYN